MKKNYIIFIRTIGGLDHVLPFIDYVLSNNKGTVQLISNVEEIPGAQDHLEFLRRIHKIKPVYLFDIVFSAFYKKIYRKYNMFVDTTQRFYIKIPYTTFFSTCIITAMFRIYLFVLSKPIRGFIYGLDNSNVIITDVGSEVNFPNKFVVKYAGKRFLSTICFIHGIMVWTNLDNIKGKHRRSDYKSIKNKIRNIIQGKRCYSDKYLTCYYQKETFFKSSSLRGFKEHERVIEVGAPRFTYEWNDVIKNYLLEKYEFKYGDRAKLNVVIFVSNFIYNVIPEMFYKTISELGALEHINLVCQARTKGELEKVDDSLFKVYKVFDIPSIVMSDWADVGILYGSSIGFQLLLDKVPIIVPSYIHTNHTIYEKYDVCIKAKNIEELKRILSHDKESIRSLFKHKKSNKFINDIVYGNKTYQQLMEAYLSAVDG